MEAVSLLKIPPKISRSELPRWLTESYPGAEQEMADWYYGYYFWRKWDGQEHTLQNALVMARATAEAKWSSLQQSHQIKGTSDRSIMLQLYEAHQTHWFQYVDEIESVRELIERMLADEIERDERGGQRYEYEFILKTMLPTMEKLGAPKEQILSITENISKAKAAVPVIRQLVAAETPEAQAQIMEVFREIADPNVKVRTFKESNRERLGKAKPQTPKPIPGGIYLIPGCELIVIESDRAHTNAIQVLMRGIVEDLTIKDGGALLRYLSEKIMPKSQNFEKLSFIPGDAPRLIPNAEGYPMPTKDDMVSYVFQEAARSKFYIDSLLARTPVAYVLGYNFTQVGYTHQLAEWIAEKFHVDLPKDPVPFCRGFLEALTLYYNTIHQDLNSLYPNCVFWTEMLLNEHWGCSLVLVINRINQV